METKNELTTSTKTVSMMSAQKMYITNISKGLESIVGSADTYQLLCGYNMLNAINTLLAKENLNHMSKDVDQQSINDAIKFAMVYSLNTDNKEVFVMVRNTKIEKKENGKAVYTRWLKTIECKPQYRGQLKIVAAYGRGVKKVYPEWVVREGDEFTYPMMKGVESVPPTWTKKGGEGKVLRVVVPIKYEDGFIDYRIAERESVATNIKAQIKQALMTNKDEQKKIMALIKDYTLDQLLSDPTISDYVNETYKGISAEEMLITKLVINATKRVAIEFDSAFKRELLEKTYDNADVYTPSHKAEELAQNEAKQIEIQEVKEVKAEEPKASFVENVDATELKKEYPNLVDEETGEVSSNDDDLAAFLGD